MFTSGAAMELDRDGLLKRSDCDLYSLAVYCRSLARWLRNPSKAPQPVAFSARPIQGPYAGLFF